MRRTLFFFFLVAAAVARVSSLQLQDMYYPGTALGALDTYTTSLLSLSDGTSFMSVRSLLPIADLRLPIEIQRPAKPPGGLSLDRLTIIIARIASNNTILWGRAFDHFESHAAISSSRNGDDLYISGSFNTFNSTSSSGWKELTKLDGIHGRLIRWRKRFLIPYYVFLP